MYGRLDTRYSPVRRSPSICIATNHAAPRLACVKPVASVHPEPGSNSSLLILFYTFCSESLSVYCSLDGMSVFLLRLLYYLLICNAFKELFSLSLSERGCKDNNFYF